jgi:hypothetical protein
MKGCLSLEEDFLRLPPVHRRKVEVKNAESKKHRTTKRRKTKRRMGQYVEWKKRRMGQNVEEKTYIED